jgi:hypothetical protein
MGWSYMGKLGTFKLWYGKLSGRHVLVGVGRDGKILNDFLRNNASRHKVDWNG